jgi:hypothetical protein
MGSKLKCPDCGGDVVLSWNPDMTLMTVVCEHCMKEKKIDALQYRVLTGICETCHLPMEGHPKCAACGILCGPGHIYGLSTYHGAKVCSGCLHSWKVLEKKKGKELTWPQVKSIWRPWQREVEEGQKTSHKNGKWLNRLDVVSVPRKEW